MQYLLTAEEYSEIIKKRQLVFRIDVEKLQMLCTKIANEMPVPREWAKDDAIYPWGCILNERNNPGYCDECPVPDICPYEHKKWSK